MTTSAEILRTAYPKRNTLHPKCPSCKSIDISKCNDAVLVKDYKKTLGSTIVVLSCNYCYAIWSERV